MHAHPLHRAIERIVTDSSRLPVEPAARRIGIVEVADALDLLPPALDVLREAVFLTRAPMNFCAGRLASLLGRGRSGLDAGDRGGAVEQVEGR